MAKKEKVDSAAEATEQVLSQKELEAKFSGEDEPTEKEAKKVKIKSKSTFSLEDYKTKIGSSMAHFKPQTWIPMSPAFQKVSGLPGIPEGHLVVNFGKSDTGKSTMALELAKYAQEQGVLVVFLITEKKWSWERCSEIGIDVDACLIKDDIDFIEEGCDIIEEILKDQVEGRLTRDVVFIWDSIGATPSRKEFEASEEEGKSGGGMMVTARVLRERITRRISYKINNTRRETHPYNATLFIVNQAYQSPPSFPGGPTTLVPYGGDALTYSATLVFRMGGVMSNSSKVKAAKDGMQMAFAIKSALVVHKNHITNVSPDGKILCTPHGFIEDDKNAIDAYKKEYKDGWALEFDKDWNSVTKD
jgi:RecA/RadA recombinase